MTIVTWKRPHKLRIGANGPTLEYEGKTYKPTDKPNDPFGAVSITFKPNTPVKFIELGDYGLAQIEADHGVIQSKKEAFNENIDLKPAKSEG